MSVQYFRDLDKYNLLSNEKTIELFKQGTKEAKDKIVEGNLRLVIKIAKQNSNDTEQFLEMIQEGNIGLIKAVNKFDYENYENKFSTYAVWWIKREISRYHQKDMNINISNYGFGKIGQIKSFISKFKEVNDREPTISEIKDNLDSNIREKTLLSIISFKDDTISLNQKCGNSSDDQDTELGDMIKSKTDNDPKQKQKQDELKNVLNNSLTYVSDTKAKILRMRFGLNQKRMTLKEIANKMNCSIPNVHLKINEALDEIKAMDMLHDLSSFC